VNTNIATDARDNIRESEYACLDMSPTKGRKYRKSHNAAKAIKLVSNPE